MRALCGFLVLASRLLCCRASESILTALNINTYQNNPHLKNIYLLL